MENGKTLESILALAQLTQADTTLWVVNFGFIITECRSLYWITLNNRHFHTTFEGKKRIKVSLIITVHSAVTTCVSIPWILSSIYCSYWSDLASSVPLSTFRRWSSDCKYNCFGCTRRAVAGSVANVSLFTVLDTLSYIHNTPAILNRLMELEKSTWMIIFAFW